MFLTHPTYLVICAGLLTTTLGSPASTHFGFSIDTDAARSSSESDFELISYVKAPKCWYQDDGK